MATDEERKRDFSALVYRCLRRKLQGQADRDDEAVLWASAALAHARAAALKARRKEAEGE